jgi:tripartite-type tricarboxylate transporter receptor subunit TctC
MLHGSRWLAALLLALAACGSASADTYPTRPITLVVPFPPGGPTDSSARLVAKTLALKLGQPIVVENHGGAGGTIGPTYVSKATADGYTLLWGGTSSLAMGPALYPHLNYDPLKSFAPISMVVRSPDVLAARSDLAAGNLQALIAEAKAKPGALTFGSAGVGSSTHLAGEFFKSSYSIDLLHIGYNGGAPAVTALMAKQIDVLFETVPTLLPHIKSGAIKAYAVAGAKRSPLLPDVPTFREATGQDFKAYSWFGLLAPAGTPVAVIQRLVEALNATLAEKELAEPLATEGFETVGDSPDEFSHLIEAERQQWTNVVQAAHVPTY